MKVDQTLKQAIAVHREGKLKEAELLYLKILKIQPKNIDANNNLGVIKVSKNESAASLPFFKTAIEVNPNITHIWVSYAGALINEKKFKEAEFSYKKIIDLTPNNSIYHYNLGKLLKISDKIKEAEASYKKAIELNPNFVEAHSNLGSLLEKLSRFDEAEKILKKAIELKPNFAAAHNNIGNLHQNLGKFDKAEVSYKRVLELEPGHVMARKNLITLKKQKVLLSKILYEKNISTKNLINNFNLDIKLDTNPLILERQVEPELVSNLYKMNISHFTKTKDARYGNGWCSNFELLENESSIIKVLTNDLTEIMQQAVKSKIYIIDSFFNILSSGSGTAPHNHLNSFDKVHKLTNQKFSLTYYLAVGDQDSTEPGILKVYNPDKDILPSNGQIVIIPAYRMHSAVYNGKKDRVMVGVNFYSLN